MVLRESSIGAKWKDSQDCTDLRGLYKVPKSTSVITGFENIYNEAVPVFGPICFVIFCRIVRVFLCL